MLVLLHLYDEWNDFRIQEYNSILDILNVPQEYHLDEKNIYTNQSFITTSLPSENIAIQICQRAVLVRGIFELWAQGDTFGELVDHVKLQSPSISTSWITPEKSWSVEIMAYCKNLSHSQKEILRQHFKCLNFQGPVVLNNPDLNLGVLLDYSKVTANSEGCDERNPQVPCYCGRLLARGGMRDELRKYDLKKRLYLGPTSLDHSLALIMANLAGAKKGSMALDPFVGTGSILVALSHFGAHCTGMDIDVRVLKGAMYAGASRDASAVAQSNLQQTFVPGVGHVNPTANSTDADTFFKKRDIMETFRSYDLALPELVRMDLHLLDRHLGVSSDSIFDLIVTDPPYGIRAGGRKSGKTNGCSYTIAPDERMDHIPSTQNYPVEEVMLDLLHAAAKLLKVGGALCYLIPTSYDFKVDDLPKHPCLTMKRLCHQGLSTRHGRHAVLMHKICEYSHGHVQDFDRYRQAILSYSHGSQTCEILSESDGFCKLLGKLEQALSSGGFENDAVVKNASKGALRRKDSAKKRQVSTYDGPFNGRPKHIEKHKENDPGEDVTGSSNNNE